jgi:hypothetical protein
VTDGTQTAAAQAAEVKQQTAESNASRYNRSLLAFPYDQQGFFFTNF